MKRKIIAFIILALILGACILGINYLLDSTDDSVNEAILETKTTTEIRSQVYSECLTNKIKLNGTVVNKRDGENYAVSSEIGDKETVILTCQIHDIVSSGDVVFTINSKEYKSEVNGIIMDICNEKNYISVTILDYDSLFINAGIDYTYIDKLQIGSKMSVLETNPLASKNMHEETVENIGCYVEDNKVEIELSNSVHYLPGTSLEVDFEYSDDVSSCYILKKMLMEDAEGKYVYVIQSNGDRIKKYVETGREFTTTDGEVCSEFIEICSGLKEGDCLVVDEVM